MVNCVMRRDDQRCAQCGVTRDRLVRLNTPACCPSNSNQIRAVHSRPLLCESCSRKAAAAATVPARRVPDVQRRRAATSGDKSDPENCFTALFQRAEACNNRPRSRASSAHLLGVQRRTRTPTGAATASKSVSSHQEGEIRLFYNKPLPRKLHDPPASSSKSSHRKQGLGSPVGLDLGQVDLRRQPTRLRRHTTSTLPPNETSVRQEESVRTSPPRLSPRERMERAKSQQYPTNSVLVDLSYLSDYK